MGFNYIVMVWILWHLNAPMWVWGVMVIAIMVERILAMLENKLREQP